MFTVTRISLSRSSFSKGLEFKIFRRNVHNKSVSGKNATAVIFGGFGFGEKQMLKYSSLYDNYNFKVCPVLMNVKEMTTPAVLWKRAKPLAEELQNKNQPVVVHCVSGSFWTMITMFELMDKDWREKYIKAIVFDSTPPYSDIYAFGGWLSFRLKRPHLKPYLSHLFYPYIYLCGITEDWRHENNLKMFGKSSVIPRGSHILFIHCKNDPVLNHDYLKKFMLDVRANQLPTASVTEQQFERSRHAMSIVDYPEEYKEIHFSHVLDKVPEWRL